MRSFSKIQTMFRCVAVAVLVALVSANPNLDEHWKNFKRHHGKSYASHEEPKKRAIWENNVKYIRKHNLEYDLGKHSYFLGMNEFSDLTHEEFKEKMLGFKPESVEIQDSQLYMEPENFKAPSSVDWRTQGLVTGVKNQGSCGSCWAFSTTGSLEGQWKRKHGRLPNLSEQQLVDCAGGRFGNKGCGGGNPASALKYIQAAGGIDSESSYPYKGRQGSCRFSKSAVAATDSGVSYVSRGSESALTNAVASVGPVSVGIDANHPSFMHYRGGLYDNPQCSSTRLDHAVLTVGYGSNYWLVKNSWGTSWGQGGYVQMARNKGNQCGIASFACYPRV